MSSSTRRRQVIFCYCAVAMATVKPLSPFRAWSLGQANSHLSYYDGLIQLVYSNGSQYNDDRHTARSTLISFLCDPDAGAGQPEFQVKKFKFFKTAFGLGSSSAVIDFSL